MQTISVNSPYLSIWIFVIIGFTLAIAMGGFSFLLAKQSPDDEKLSPFECGVPAIDDARGRYNIRFYLVALLFILFDLEVVFLFPWVAIAGVSGQSFVSFLVLLGFLVILTVGFLYEWRKGALEWE